VTVRIGLTGPIGCGKSTVARWLAEDPAVRAIDADQVARTVLEPGSAGLQAVLDRFGGALLAEDGSLDRAALGRIVFADPAALADLEAIVHPLVRPRILAAIADAEEATATAVVIEAIKLVEGGLAALCDEVWLVTCDPAAQQQRLFDRGMDADDAAARTITQGDLAERVGPRATRILDTSGDADATHDAAEAALRAALAGQSDSLRT
jgi:dephospho-CoA kinase